MLFEKLSQFGIPDNEITIKIAKEPHKNGYVGWYKSKSAFTSKPIFYLDMAAHENMAKNSVESLDELVMSTLLHEYAHVIEELVQHGPAIEKNPEFIIAQKELSTTFFDNEDFSEDFSLYLMGRNVSEAKIKAIQTISSIYAKSVFNEADIEFGKKEKWEKEILALMNKNKDFIEKLSTSEGSFNQCKRVCEIFFERLSSDVDAKIIRLEGYNGDVSLAHKKWHKIGGQNMIHYALLFNEKTVYDFTFNQFKPQSETPIIEDFESYLKKWDNFTYFAVKSTTKKQFNI